MTKILRRPIAIASLALALLAVFLATSAGAAASSTSTVPGNSNNYITGITLSGNSVSITASGAWTCLGPVGNSPCQTGPNGTGTPGGTGFLAEGLSAFSLIARVGSGPWQFVGAGPTVINGTGDLTLAMNDDIYGDNDGEMEVTIATLTSQSATFLGGVGTPGTVMDGVDASFNGDAVSPTWQPAYLARKANGVAHPWGLVTGTTQWISACTTLDDASCIGVGPEGGLDDVFIWYRIRFDVPANWFDVTMDFTVRVDNAATLYLNGDQIAGRFVGGNFEDGFSESLDDGALQVGTNTIIVLMEDWGGLSGINYRIDLSGLSTAPIVVIEPDSDGDGVNDSADSNATDPCVPSNTVPACDSDSDGVPDGTELLNGTDPNNADTDGDGVNDSADSNATDPCVPSNTVPACDSDGVPDGTELLNGTDPNKADTDGDGVNDGADSNATDPCVPSNTVLACDSDSDGVPNGSDEHPNSDLRGKVWVNGCNSGVANSVFPSGSSIADLVTDAFSAGGEESVEDLVEALEENGTLTEDEAEAIEECAEDDDDDEDEDDEDDEEDSDDDDEDEDD